ncbi:MAG: hypothetical protein N2171_06075 [Clostridia bacterium]|nr:hypothetical protein [Clostridia bacterium]
MVVYKIKMNNRKEPAFVLKDDKKIADFKYYDSPHNYNFIFDGKNYEIIVKKTIRPVINLEVDSTTVGSALISKGMFFLKVEISFFDQHYILKKYFFTRDMIILIDKHKIGNVMPDGILSDNIKILINSEVSELLGIFIGWLVFFSWLYTYQFA